MVKSISSFPYPPSPPPPHLLHIQYPTLTCEWSIRAWTQLCSWYVPATCGSHLPPCTLGSYVLQYAAAVGNSHTANHRPGSLPQALTPVGRQAGRQAGSGQELQAGRQAGSQTGRQAGLILASQTTSSAGLISIVRQWCLTGILTTLLI